MDTDLITPIILTYNEAPNIGHSLERLTWAKQILVIDSYSTDETVEIAQKYAAVKVIQRKFDSFAGQCNFGVSRVVTPWVLSLDADYILSDELIKELSHCELTANIDGYTARFVYCVYGKPLRGTLYPPRTVLYRKNRAQYQDDGHGHRVEVAGHKVCLTSCIYHDDRKSLARWLQSQSGYMVIESRKLLETPNAQLNRADRIRKNKILAPLLVMFYCLFGKGIIFDGWPGWYYVLQRTLAEMLLSLHLIEEGLKNSSDEQPKL